MQNNRFENIVSLCKEKNISLAEVCRELKIPYATVYQWRRAQPKAFDYETKIIDYLNKT